MAGSKIASVSVAGVDDDEALAGADGAQQLGPSPARLPTVRVARLDVIHVLVAVGDIGVPDLDTTWPTRVLPKPTRAAPQPG